MNNVKFLDVVNVLRSNAADTKWLNRQQPMWRTSQATVLEALEHRLLAKLGEQYAAQLAEVRALLKRVKAP